MQLEIQMSVRQARKSLQMIKPDFCERYVGAWRQDLAEWKQRVPGIAAKPTIDAALLEMELPFAAPGTKARRILPHWPEAAPSVPSGKVVIPTFSTLQEMSALTRKVIGNLPEWTFAGLNRTVTTVTILARRAPKRQRLPKSI
jgi:hypothetical protein